MNAQAQAAKHIAEQAYDEVPYESYPYPHSFPDRLYAMGKLFGMQPVNIEKCRVLELGCAAGGNIMPLAALFPKSEFVGIDISSTQIKQAQTQQEALGLKNITFHQRDIAADNSDLGEFDYIIVHGILSWIPETVRKALFTLVGKQLSPNGLAMISYNTLPGWNMVRSIRDMMRYHAARFETPAEKVQQSRMLLDFVYENTPESMEAYRSALDSERKMLATANETYIMHDHLEADNTQFYFHEFMQEAAQEGLQYVADCALSSMFLGNLKAGAQEKLGAVNDIVLQEQYMDFINNRRFRNTILARKDVKLSRNLDKKQIFDFHVTAHFRPKEPVPANFEGDVIFASPGGATFTTHAPHTTALFAAFAEQADLPVKIDDAIKAAQKKMNTKDDAPFKKAMEDIGMQLALAGLITLSVHRADFITEAGQKPRIWDYALKQVATGSKHITSMTGAAQPVDAALAILAPKMDEKHTREDLTALMLENVKNGTLTMNENGQPVTDAKRQESLCAEATQNYLNTLAAKGFFVA